MKNTSHKWLFIRKLCFFSQLSIFIYDKKKYNKNLWYVAIKLVLFRMREKKTNAYDEEFLYSLSRSSSRYCCCSKEKKTMRKHGCLMLACKNNNSNNCTSSSLNRRIINDDNRNQRKPRELKNQLMPSKSRHMV